MAVFANIGLNVQISCRNLTQNIALFSQIREFSMVLITTICTFANLVTRISKYLKFPQYGEMIYIVMLKKQSKVFR